MEKYKIISLLLIFGIYSFSMFPSIFIFSFNSTYKTKDVFLKKLIISILLEIIIFSLIYIFPRNIINFLINKPNIQNYTYYALKILFISSPLSAIHIGIPMFFFKNKKKKKAFALFSLKLVYIPFLFLGKLLFNTKGIYFSVPILDFIYSIFLYNFFRKSFLS